jgi:hypothetical protein
MFEMIELTDDELDVVAAGLVSIYGAGDDVTINNSGANARGSVGGLIGNVEVLTLTIS